MNGWKVAFWIVLILLILETAAVYYMVSEGLDIIENEAECSVNTCAGADSFYFDSVESMCYCLVQGEVVLQKYLGS